MTEDLNTLREALPPRIMALLRRVAVDGWQDENGESLADDARAALSRLEAAADHIVDANKKVPELSREDVVRLAKEAGIETNLVKMGAASLVYTKGVAGVTWDQFERFASLVRSVPVGEVKPVAWKHDCAALLTNDVELWVDACPHCGKPRTTPPAPIEGWRMVPVEPTPEMMERGVGAHYEAECKVNEPGAWENGGFAKRSVRAAHVYRAMLAAAPQPGDKL